MRRAPVALVALVGVLFGWVAALAPESVTIALAQQAHAYNCDGRHHAAASTSTTIERGPPAPSKPATGYSAVDRWSNGPLAPSGPVQTPTTNTYDDAAPLVHLASDAATTADQALADSGQPPSFARSGVAADAAALESRANALHGALDPIAQNSRTTAALGTREGQTILSSGGRDLSPAQRALAQEGEVIARSPGAHAEVTAVNGARSAGLTPQGIGVSRPICPACQAFLEESGATITSPTTAWWFW